jgi:hypothetical protein
VQTNPFHFFNYQLYFRTPVLVAIAIFCWLVPIATFYPPGTLVVGIRPASIEKSFNVSVLHHRDLLDIAQNNVIAHISCHSKCIDYSCLVGPPQFPEAAENVTYLETCHSSELVFPSPVFVTAPRRLCLVFTHLSTVWRLVWNISHAQI